MQNISTAKYIEREAFLADKKWLYCTDCDKRKGKKRGKMVTLYEIGEAPCKSCGIHDMLEEVEVYPAADVRPVVKAHWYWDKDGMDWGIGSWRCSACHSRPETWWQGDSNSPRNKSGHYFCPNCGADMRETNDEKA